MNAEQWNAMHPIGTLVFAYPGCRPEDGAGTRLVTRTRTAAQMSASGDPVVWVEGEGAYICLTHIDPVAEDVWEKARAAEQVTETQPVPSDPVLSALATVEDALRQYFEGSPTPRRSAALVMSQAFCGERAASSAAYRDAADLIARYTTWPVPAAAMRDIADELHRRAGEVAS